MDEFDGTEDMGEHLPEGPPEEPPAPKDRPDVEISLYRHPLAAVGGAVVVAGVMSFLFLMFQDLTSPTENAYRSLVTFVAIPMVIGLGVGLFLLAFRRQVVAARKRGERARFVLKIEPTNAKYMRNLWLFLALSAVGVAVVGLVGFKGYEATESTTFCGETCHVPMEPEAVSHQHGPHAKVACVECHIGPGTEAYIKAKANGMKQLWGVATNSYERPIETPIPMRSAEEVCEECHWPDRLLGTKFVTNTYFSLGREPSPWTITLMLDLGTAHSTGNDVGGVHWHTSNGNEVDYIASDEELQEINWVRVTNRDGTETTFTAPGHYVPPPSDPDVEIRRLDCLDCHNRPAHALEVAPTAVNNALATRRISLLLPEIKDAAMIALLNHYVDREAAHVGIRASLTEFYGEKYPNTVASYPAEIEQAIAAITDIYDINFFPEMKTDYRVRQYNDGHLAWEGCFRCHDGEKADAAGNVIPNNCNSCHKIVGQGPGVHLLLPNPELGGVPFMHPYGVTKWQERSCSSCHADLAGVER